MQIWINDPKDGKPSVTLTLLISGFALCAMKLLGSGLEVGSIKLAVFGGGDFAAAVGALGALYAARRHPSMNAKSGDDDAIT